MVFPNYLSPVKRIAAIAEILKVSERQVSAWISEGIIPCYRIGRLVFLDEAEVFDAIRAHGRKQPSDELIESEKGGR